MTFLENTKKGRPRIEYALTLDKVFSTWIRDRIAQYDFVENQDFVWVSQNYETQRAVRLCGKSRLCSLPQKMEAKERYEFVENQDFVTFSENSEKGRPRLEYALTLDKTSLLGLRTVLRSMVLWKIKTLLSSTKKWSFQRAGGQRG